jgi:hypothetical protein
VLVARAFSPAAKEVLNGISSIYETSKYTEILFSSQGWEEKGAEKEKEGIFPLGICFLQIQ